MTRAKESKTLVHLQNLNVLRSVSCLVKSGITSDVCKHGFDCGPLP